MVHSSYISISTSKRCCWVDITGKVEDTIRSSKIKNGICNVTSLHTTGGITINENADPDVEYDFFKKISSLIPVDSQFRHCEGNSDSHIKTSLVGPSVQLSIVDGKIILGTWQSIYFCEFDGPRSRRCVVTVVGDTE